MRRLLVGLGILVNGGCALLPQVGRIPVLENPFEQVRRVAVAPFFNLSEEPTVDGRQFALAYYNALQSVSGFEVIPVGQVERAMREYGVGLNTPQEACRLAQWLGADAIVIGAVTDYSPYYPPRLGLRVEWYPANPGGNPSLGPAEKGSCCETSLTPSKGDNALATQTGNSPEGTNINSLEGQVPTQKTGQNPPHPPILPLVTHTRIYNGHDAEFTAALSRYHLTRDDARFAGWQTYLERSDDFIRFCCYKHLEEMLLQHGGARQTKLVWRWSLIR
jgi:hypothetical protein